MSVDLADRAAQIASRARAREPAEKPRELTTDEARKLHATAERSRPVAYWYHLTRPGQDTIDVAFCPEVTLQEARAWYPLAAIEPM